MAVGDFYVRRNSSNTDAVPNAGTNLDSNWDTVAREVGSGITYSDPNFSLGQGTYLIMYSEKFGTTDTSNNERIEVQGEIHISGSGVQGGYGQDYIRKSSGQQDCIVSGYMFLTTGVGTTDVFIRFYRTDNSTTGTVNRVPGIGGVIILQLETGVSSETMGFYSTSATEATSGNTERILNIDTNDRQDTGFSRTGTAVSVPAAGRYLATYSIDITTTGTGREDVVGRITDAGTEVVGTNSFCYVRGADGCQDGALTWIGVLDLDGTEALDVRWQAPQSATMTASAGATLQLWQLPSGNDTAIMEATTGDYNANAPFTWDTLPHIDTDSFTATAGNQNIDVDQQDFVLAFATFHNDAPDSVQRAYPQVRISVDGENSTTAAGAMYHRNSGGSGICAVTVADLLDVTANQELRVTTAPTGAGGTVTNDSGQFAVVSLDSIFGPYAFPPNISVVEDDAIAVNELDVDITGANFGATQGTGKVELASSGDYAAATKVLQTVNTWSDTLINIDSSIGGLSEGTLYMFVTSDTGSRSPGYPLSVGLAAYDAVISLLGPQHHWELDGTYLDSGTNGNNPMTASLVGDGGSMELDPICEKNTQSWLADNRVARETADSNDMNLQAETARTMGGWIRVNQIGKDLSCIYKEGGSVNNLCFFLGMGNVLIAQLADTSDDNAQAYSDFKLTVDRPYHIMFRFDYGDTTPEFRMYIDGELQSVTAGNPLTSTDLDAHSGDVIFAGLDTNVEVAGTDVRFLNQESTNYAQWASWTTALDPVTEIRDKLFRRGARPDVTISGDTYANMQTDIETYDDTTRPDAPLAFRINGSTEGADLDLTLTNIVFDDGITMQIEWRGTGTLTLTNSGTTNLDINKTFAPNGGTVVIQQAVDINITAQDIDTGAAIEDARVYILAEAGGPLTAGTVLYNDTTDPSGQISTTLVYSSDQPITGRIRKGEESPFYKEGTISGKVTSNGFDATILMIRDE